MNLVDMNGASVEDVQAFYESLGFEVESGQDRSGNPTTQMQKNCSFRATHFTPESGNEKATEPFWRTTPSGKEYCLVMGIAKVKGLQEIANEPKICILNKTSYDRGDFELDTLYSSICNIPLLGADGNKAEDFNDIYFTVFENQATNNDMSDMASNKFAEFMAKRKAEAEA
jgi:hypothetical protein